MPGWVPWKTHVSPAPQAQVRPTRSTPVTGSRSSSKLGLQAPTLEARPWKWCLYLHLSSSPISRSEKSRSPWQESNKPSRSHNVLWIINIWLDQGSNNGQSLTDTDRENSVTKLCPWPRDTTCNTHQYPYHIPARSPFPFSSFYHGGYNNNNNHLLVGMKTVRIFSDRIRYRIRLEGF
jgi:hypothetical protein